MTNLGLPSRTAKATYVDRKVIEFVGMMVRNGRATLRKEIAKQGVFNGIGFCVDGSNKSIREVECGQTSLSNHVAILPFQSCVFLKSR